MNLDPILKRIGVTQKDLAQEVGVREEQVSRWVNGHHIPDGLNLHAILTAVQKRDPSITLDDLIGSDLPKAAGE